jgi:nucleoid-associated protein YgaU
MRTSKRKLTLMPAVALAALALAVTLPAIAGTVHAAPPVSYHTVTVRSGDSLWALAERQTPNGGDVQAVVDTIIAANHMNGAAINVGQKLRIPG